MSNALPSLRGLSKLSSQVRQSSYDPVLNRYVREEEERAKKRKFQPLRMVFDLLSRPQYVTANIAEEITRSLQSGEPIGQAAQDVLRGVWEGATGKRKGDWETILFGGTPEGGEQFSGWFPGAGEQLSHPIIKLKPGAEGQERGILRPKKMIGLAANIVMDPTTWIGMPKPTSAARASAKRFAEDTVEVVAKDPSLLKNIVATIDPTKVKGLQKLAGKIVGADATRKYLDDVYKEAYKVGLKTPANELIEKTAQALGKVPQQEMLSPGIKDIMERIVSSENLYGGSGYRAMPMFGKEVGASLREPNRVAQTFSLVKDAFARTPTGSFFKDAWWSVMNKGPVGAVRKMFGFRNPYASLAWQKAREADLGFHASQARKLEELRQVAGDLTDEEQATITKIFDTAWKNEGERIRELKLTKATPGTGPMQYMLEEPISYLDILDNPAKYGINPDDARVLAGTTTRVADFLKKLRDVEQEFVRRGNLPEYGELLNYVPIHHNSGDSMYAVGSATGKRAPGFTKPKYVGFEKGIEEAKRSADLVYGDLLKRAMETAKPGSEFAGTYDQVLDTFVRKHGFANISTDLREMLMHRVTAHVKAARRDAMVTSFKEFGVPLSEIAGDVNQRSVLFQLQRIGLDEAQDPAFAGYVFDKDVRQIIDKVYLATTNKETQNALLLAFRRMTQRWRNLVTLTPGFHVRNWMSNEWTMYMKHGVSAYDPQWTGKVMAGTAYALNPGKYEDFLSSTMKASPGFIKRELNTRIGDLTTKDLADEALKRGVISPSTRMVDLPEDLASMASKGKTSKNIVIEGSHKIGNIVESSSKFKSFLIDFKTAIDGGSSTDEALEWAAQETRKWFIDYGDLTDFEKNVMRNVMPFYSWLRKNIANQLTGILMYPQAYQLTGKLMESAKEDKDYDYSIVPEYFEEQGMFPVSTDPQTGYPILFRPDFPFKDINMIPLTFDEESWKPGITWRQATDDVMQAAHPLIKTAMAILPTKGWNFFRRTDIKKQETAPAVFQYFTKSPQVLGFLDGVLRMAGFEEGVKADMSRDNNRVVMDGKAVQIMENHMPALRIAGNLLQTGEKIASVLSGRGDLVEDMIEEVSGKRDYYEGLEAVLQILSRWGIKFKTFNEDYYKPVAKQKILDAARERKRSDEYNAITAQQRSAAQQRSRNATLRRYGLL